MVTPTGAGSSGIGGGGPLQVEGGRQMGADRKCCWLVDGTTTTMKKKKIKMEVEVEAKEREAEEEQAGCLALSVTKQVAAATSGHRRPSKRPALTVTSPAVVNRKRHEVHAAPAPTAHTTTTGKQPNEIKMNYDSIEKDDREKEEEDDGGEDQVYRMAGGLSCSRDSRSFGLPNGVIGDAPEQRENKSTTVNNYSNYYQQQRTCTIAKSAPAAGEWSCGRMKLINQQHWFTQQKRQGAKQTEVGVEDEQQATIATSSNMQPDAGGDNDDDAAAAANVSPIGVLRRGYASESCRRRSSGEKENLGTNKKGKGGSIKNKCDRRQESASFFEESSEKTQREEEEEDRRRPKKIGGALLIRRTGRGRHLASKSVMWPSWWRQLVLLSFLSILMTSLLSHLNIISGASPSPCSLFNHCHALSLNSNNHNNHLHNNQTPTVKPELQTTTITINSTNNARSSQQTLPPARSQQQQQLLSSASSDVVVVAPTSLPALPSQQMNELHAGEPQRITGKTSVSGQGKQQKQRQQQQVSKQQQGGSESITQSSQLNNKTFEPTVAAATGDDDEDDDRLDASTTTASTGGVNRYSSGNNGTLKFSFGGPASSTLNQYDRTSGLSIEDDTNYNRSRNGNHNSNQSKSASAGHHQASSRVSQKSSESRVQPESSTSPSPSSSSNSDSQVNGGDQTSSHNELSGSTRHRGQKKKLIQATGGKPAPQEYIDAISASKQQQKQLQQSPFVPIISSPSPQQSSTQAIKVIAAPQPALPKSAHLKHVAIPPPEVDDHILTQAGDGSKHQSSASKVHQGDQQQQPTKERESRTMRNSSITNGEQSGFQQQKVHSLPPIEHWASQAASAPLEMLGLAQVPHNLSSTNSNFAPRDISSELSQAHLSAAMATNWSPEPAYLLSTGPLATPPADLAFMHRLPPHDHQRAHWRGGANGRLQAASSQLFGLSMPHELIQPGAGAQWFQLGAGDLLGSGGDHQHTLLAPATGGGARSSSHEHAMLSGLAQASASRPLVMRPQPLVYQHAVGGAAPFHHLFTHYAGPQHFRQLSVGPQPSASTKSGKQRPPQRGKHLKRPSGHLLSTASASAPSISLPPLSHLLSPRNPFRLFSSSSTPIGFRHKPSSSKGSSNQSSGNGQQSSTSGTRFHNHHQAVRHWAATASQPILRPFGFQGTAKLNAMDQQHESPATGSGAVTIGASLYAHPHSAEQLEQLVRAASQATGVHTPILPAIVSGPAGQTFPGFYIPAIESESESQVNELRHGEQVGGHGNSALTSRIPGTDYILHPEEVRAMMSVGESAWRKQQAPSASSAAATSESQQQFMQHPASGMGLPEVSDRWRTMDMLMRENHAQNLRDFAYVEPKQQQQHSLMNASSNLFPAIIRLNDQDYIHWPLFKTADQQGGHLMSASNQQASGSVGWRSSPAMQESQRQYSGIGPFHALYAAASGQPPAPSALPGLNFGPGSHLSQTPSTSEHHNGAFLLPQHQVPSSPASAFQQHQMSKVTDLSTSLDDQTSSASNSPPATKSSSSAGGSASSSPTPGEFPPENSPVRLATQLTPSEISQVEDSIVEALLMAQQLQRQRRMMRQLAASLQAPVYTHPNPMPMLAAGAHRHPLASQPMPVAIRHWQQPQTLIGATAAPPSAPIKSPKGLRFRTGLFRRRRRNSAPAKAKPLATSASSQHEQLILSHLFPVPSGSNLNLSNLAAASPLVAPLIQFASLGGPLDHLPMVAYHPLPALSQQRQQTIATSHSHNQASGAVADLQSTASQLESPGAAVEPAPMIRQAKPAMTVMADQETNKPQGYFPAPPTSISSLIDRYMDMQSEQTEPRASVVAAPEDLVEPPFGGRLRPVVSPASQAQHHSSASHNNPTRQRKANEITTDGRYGKSGGSKDRAVEKLEEWMAHGDRTTSKRHHTRPVGERINVDWPAMASDADYFPPHNAYRDTTQLGPQESRTRESHQSGMAHQRVARPLRQQQQIHRTVSQVYAGSGSSNRPKHNSNNFVPSQLKLQFAQDYQDREGVPIYNNNVRVAGAVGRQRQATTMSHNYHRQPTPASRLQHHEPTDQADIDDETDEPEARAVSAASRRRNVKQSDGDEIDETIDEGDDDLARGRTNQVELRQVSQAGPANGIKLNSKSANEATTAAAQVTSARQRKFSPKNN